MCYVLSNLYKSTLVTIRYPARPMETTTSSERQSHELRKDSPLAVSKAAETLMHVVTFFLSLKACILRYAERLLLFFLFLFLILLIELWFTYLNWILNERVLEGIIDVNGRVLVLALVTANYQLLLNILPLGYDSEVITGTHQTTTSQCILSI